MLITEQKKPRKRNRSIFYIYNNKNQVLDKKINLL